jgi:UDP-2-acetamido-3-amino-2,3-dideoxy-glucuronate N-acetyltransferase
VKRTRTRARAGAAPRVYGSSVVQEGAELGLDTVVGAFCFVAKGARVGVGTRIQSHTSVWDGVELGEDVFVGPAATFTNVRRPRAKYPRAPDWDRTVVEDGATIGAAAVLVAPLRVGARAMIGAGAVVVRDVPPNAIVAGNPARVIGWACACGERLSRASRAPVRARCAHCGAHWTRDRHGGLRSAQEE